MKTVFHKLILLGDRQISVWKTGELPFVPPAEYPLIINPDAGSEFVRHSNFNVSKQVLNVWFEPLDFSDVDEAFANAQYKEEKEFYTSRGWTWEEE